MARVALINYHLGSIAVSEALFKALGCEPVSIALYHHRHPRTHPEFNYKILRGIHRIYNNPRIRHILHKSKKVLFGSPEKFRPEYPAPLMLYRFLNFVGLLKDEDYIAAVIFISFRYLQRDVSLTPQQLERFSQLYSNHPVFKRFFSNIDHIATSYIPRLAHIAKVFADIFNLRLIILSGHRFNVPANSHTENELIKKTIRETHQNPKHIFASASLYDSMYAKHYLNIEPEPLFNFSFHINQKIEKPDNNIILLGPTHAHLQPQARQRQEQIRQAYAQFCDGNRLTPKFVFQFIRDAYKGYHELNQLAHHPAVIILPYSVFSYSQEELYDLNIPYFFPSVNFLIQSRIIYDHVLPWWIGPKLYKTIETDLEDDESPNCESEAAQRKWLPYSSMYQRENIVVFDDLADLARKIHTIDRDGDHLRQKMYAENLKRRDESLTLWAKTLNFTHGATNG